jgi:hypothetical protein
MFFPGRWGDFLHGVIRICFATGGANFMVHYFVDALRKNEAIEANERAGLINTRIVEAVHRSLESGKVEQVRPDEPYPVSENKA